MSERKSRSTRTREIITEQKTHLVDLLSQVRIYGLTHKRMVEKTAAWHQQNRDRKLPQWAQWELRGYEEAAVKALWHYHTHWRLFFEDRYVTREEVPDGRWSEVRGGAFFWNHKPEVMFAGDPPPAPAKKGKAKK